MFFTFPRPTAFGFARAALLIALSCAWPLRATPPSTSGTEGARDPAPQTATLPVASPVPAPPPASLPPTSVPAASPAKPAKAAKPATPPPRLPVLKPGEYRWWPELAPEGPVVMVVSLPEQRLYVYRNGVRIGVSTVSTGKRGFETGTGVFPILERQREHYSNLYDSAPMPFMLRLTWSGTALHAGKVPAYPASHGCIRLPAAFAEILFEASRRDDVVVVANAASHPPEVLSPEWLTPVDPATGTVRDTAGDTAGDTVDGSWNPDLAPEGPLTAILSTLDRRLVVLRNGIEIGHAMAEVTGQPIVGTHLYRLQADPGEGTEITTGTDLPDPPPTLRWQAIAMPGTTPAPDALQPPLRGGQVRVTGTFAEQLRAALPADPTLVITDEALRYIPPAAPRVDVTTVTAPLPPAPQSVPVTP